MSGTVPTYEEIFSRNLGIFTPEQQERIRGLRIAIAGCGGLGAPVAHLLARLGVGRLHLADPEVFEASNINRQWAAYVDTLGMNKAAAVAAELQRINPDMSVSVFSDGLSDENLAAFLDGADACIDALEFFELELELQLHEAARRQRQWVFVAQGFLELNSGFAIDPLGVQFLDRIGSVGGYTAILRAVQACFPVLPEGVTVSDIEESITKGVTSLPSWCVPPVLDAAMVVSDVVSFLVKDSRPLATFPRVRIQDTSTFAVSYREAPDPHD